MLYRAMATPGLGAWVNKALFLAMGGSQERWDREAVDGLIYLGGDLDAD